ncbi:hypothetical protein GCM10009804_23150 [Kribbella hippodromi]|uniref:Uncharacterized protein n=1 Tax=Kribbella hippodromi TaxID=434347 RepID=A0ABP4NQY2_9ACTN
MRHALPILDDDIVYGRVAADLAETDPFEPPDRTDRVTVYDGYLQKVPPDVVDLDALWVSMPPGERHCIRSRSLTDCSKSSGGRVRSPP